MNITTATPRLAALLMCCCTWTALHEHLQAAEQPQKTTRTNIDPATESDGKALPEDARSLHRILWEVPLYLLSWETTDAPVPPKVLAQSTSFDRQYFEHLGLAAAPDGEPHATKAGAEVDAVKARYTIGKLKVETRQSVWVWALWIPFSEHFQATDVPAQVSHLIPALKGKITKLTSEDGKDFYVSETDSSDGHILLRQMVKKDSGVLLWGLKGNPLNSGVAMSSQMWVNRGWFKSTESRFK